MGRRRLRDSRGHRTSGGASQLKRPLNDRGDELLRLRPEHDGSTGRRFLLWEGPNGGATITIADDSERYETAVLDLHSVELLASMLSLIASRGRRALCAWCDGTGVIEGDDGPERCDHPDAIDT